MIDIKIILKNDRICKAITGMEVEQIKKLNLEFRNNLIESRIKKTPNRQRKYGGGAKGKLIKSLDKLIMCLFYLKVYPTYDLMGVFYSADRSRCCRWIQEMFEVLEMTLKRKLVLPERQINSLEEFKRLFPGIKDVFIDGTEREVARPKRAKQRGKLYSGKKKRTARKTIIIADEKKKILMMSPTKSGRRHDKRLLDKCGIMRKIPDNVSIWVDTGFVGVQREHPNIMMPKKSRKKHPLSIKEKQENKTISGLRVVVEHAIGGIKRMKSSSDKYRNRLANFDDKMFYLSAGIWNLYLQS